METPKVRDVKELSREQLLIYMQPFFKSFRDFNDMTPQDLLQLQKELGLSRILPMTRLELVEQLAYEQKKQIQARVADFFLEKLSSPPADNGHVLQEIEGIAIAGWTIHQILRAVVKERVTIDEYVAAVEAANEIAEADATAADEELRAAVADGSPDTIKVALGKRATAEEKFEMAVVSLESIVVKTENIKYFVSITYYNFVLCKLTVL